MSPRRPLYPLIILRHFTPFRPALLVAHRSEGSGKLPAYVNVRFLRSTQSTLTLACYAFSEFQMQSVKHIPQICILNYWLIDYFLWLTVQCSLSTFGHTARWLYRCHDCIEALYVSVFFFTHRVQIWLVSYQRLLTKYLRSTVDNSQVFTSFRSITKPINTVLQSCDS